MAPAGPTELAFFLFWRRGLFFARKRGGGNWCFFALLVVFLRFLVVISRFLGGFGICGRLPRNGVGGFMFNSSSSVISRFWGDFAFFWVFSRYETIISRAARFFGGLIFPAGP